MQDAVSASIVGGAPPAMTPDAVEARMIVAGASYGPESIQSPRPAVPPPGKTPPLPPVPGARPANPLGNSVQKDSVRPPGVAMPAIGQNAEWSKTMQEILAVLTRAGFDTKLVIDPFQDDNEYAAQESLVESYFSELQIFNMNSNTVEKVRPLDEISFYRQPSIIWHILGVTMLVHGKTTHAGFLKRLNKECAGVLDYVKSLTNYKQAPALKILHEILRKHVKETKGIYSKLMLCDNSIGFSTPRALIIVDWTNRLKSDAYECWERNRTRTRLHRLTLHVASVRPTEATNGTSGAETVTNEFPDEEP